MLNVRYSAVRWTANVVWLVIFLPALILEIQAQQQDPFSINGGSILAMAGKDSVAIAVDKRFGSGPQVGFTFYTCCISPT